MSVEDDSYLGFSESENEDIGEEFDYNKPCRVIVSHDYRTEEEKLASGGDLAWQRGWYLGMYEFPDLTKKRPDGVTDDWIVHNPELGDESEVTAYSPLLFTDSGCFIWGSQSDWGEDIEALNLTLPNETALRIGEAIKLIAGGISQDNLGKN